MTTLENTISMMKSLPETDLLEIQKLTVKLFQRRSGMTDAEANGAVGRFLKPMTEDDFFAGYSNRGEAVQQWTIPGDGGGD